MKLLEFIRKNLKNIKIKASFKSIAQDDTEVNQSEIEEVFFDEKPKKRRKKKDEMCDDVNFTNIQDIGPIRSHACNDRIKPWNG